MSYTLNYTGSEIDDILDRAAPGGALDTAIAAKQDALTFDAVPTEGSTNPAESGGIYDAIQAGVAAALVAFATDTVSGDVVSFPDGADNIPVKSFTGSIIPLQSGSGDPAPDNIRPISGWTGADITRAGKNLFNAVLNRAINISTGEVVTSANTEWVTDAICIGDTKDITLSIVDKGSMTNGSINLAKYDKNGGFLGYSNITYFSWPTTVFTTNLADDVATIRYFGYQRGGAQGITSAKIQVEYGSTATAYEAYQGDTILLDFGQTVYGGSINATTGVLTIDWAKVTLTGVGGTWSKSTSHPGSYYISASSLGFLAKSAGGELKCSHLEYTPVIDSTHYVVGKCALDNSVNLYLGDASQFPTTQDFTAYLAAQYAAGTPVEISGKTWATTVQLDPVTLKTLLGANTVWTDVGSVTGMTYRADTALYIQKLLNGGGTLSTLSMASPSPSLSLGRVGVLAEPEVSEPEQTEEVGEQTEQAEEE